MHLNFPISHFTLFRIINKGTDFDPGLFVTRDPDITLSSVLFLVFWLRKVRLELKTFGIQFQIRPPLPGSEKVEDGMI